MAFRGEPIRVLVVPGLRNSGPTHWQSWLQSHFRGAVRVEQDDWGTPDLPRWSARIDETLKAARRPTRWVAVAHSFGCLALAHHLAEHGGASPIAAALMVAPADPAKFGVTPWLPSAPLPVPLTLLGSETDPWMPATQAQAWAGVWGARFINLGDVGHVNVESGFGQFPMAKSLTAGLLQRVQRERRLDRAHVLELSFAV
jgi:uncharacterized protein